MSYKAYVVKVDQLRPHTNADRLQIATFFGNDTIVDLKVKAGDCGVYFPSDGQLSERFCQVNNLVRRKDENGNEVGGYLDPVKRNIKPLKLRGEKSDGLYLPLTCLADFCAISDLKPGDTIDVVNGEEICRKYIPHQNHASGGHRSGGQRKARANIAPTFYEHVETEQLAYNLDKFKAGDVIQLTLKMHGTSGRTGYLPLVTDDKRTFFQRLFRKPAHTHLEYGYITGTRRVVLANGHTGGWYESDDFRHAMAKKFEGKLLRGEVAYYEIVGFQGPNGAPIMGQVQNSKIKDKEFSKQYGDVTTFSYGCEQSGNYDTTPPCCEVYVYRMTMVNEDGDVVEYSPAQIKYRCEQMGVNVVPEFGTFVIPPDPVRIDDDGHVVDMSPGEYVVRKVECYFDGPDPIGKTHVREGVVARILNRPSFAVYKMKNFSFKILEGIIKDEADAPDMEEAQEEVSE